MFTNFGLSLFPVAKNLVKTAEMYLCMRMLHPVAVCVCVDTLQASDRKSSKRQGAEEPEEEKPEHVCLCPSQTDSSRTFEVCENFRTFWTRVQLSSIATMRSICPAGTQPEINSTTHQRDQTGRSVGSRTHRHTTPDALLQSTSTAKAAAAAAVAGWCKFDSTLPSVQQKQMLLEVLRISEMKEEMPRRMMMMMMAATERKIYRL